MTPSSVTLDFKYLFQPRSIAVVGASRDETEPGGMFISGLLKNGYTGEIYPINRKETKILSLKSYPSVLNVPKVIDLVVVTIPSLDLPQIMAECAQKGIRFAIIHSGGFSEPGDEGRKLEGQILKAARRGGVRIIGPNCMGILSPRGSVNTIAPYARLPMEPGGIAFVGQSRWASENMACLGNERGLRFSGIVSIGNQSDLTTEDFLEYFGNDSETTVFATYIETIKQPQRFLKLVDEISKKKPIIVWKGGSSGLGVRAATFHTGSLVGNYALFEAASRQKGMIFVRSLDELMDIAVAFNCHYLPTGRQVGLLTETGGSAVAVGDLCATVGLKVSPLPQNIQQKLNEFLKNRIPHSGSLKNPVDLVMVPFSEASFIYATCLEIMSYSVDSCLMICYAFIHDEWFLSRLESIRDQAKKPIIVVPANSVDQRQGMELAIRRGIPTFAMPENAVRALAALTQRAEYLKLCPRGRIS